MSTTQDQAAAQTTPDQLTDAEKKRLADLPSQIYEAEQRTNAPNPEGKPAPNENAQNAARRAAFEAQREKDRQLAQALKTEFESLRSRASPVIQQAVSEGGKRSTFQSDVIAVQEYGGNIFPESGQYHFSSSPVERKTQQGLAELAAYYPYATQKQILDYFDARITETELAQKDAERAGTFGDYSTPKPEMGFARRPGKPENVEVDYAATLAARQAGYNVGSGLTRNLPETFRKDEEKRFGERNKFIGLTENIYTSRAPPPTPAPSPAMPQNPRKHILTGQPASEFAAPGFVRKGMPQQVHVLDSSLPVSGTEFSSGPFNVSGQNATAAIFNIAPEKPKRLSDADVARMSPAEIAAYNKQVETWNQYAGYVTEQSKAFAKAQKIVNQGKWEQNKKELLKYIAEAKKEGVQFVSINTKSGDKTVPIDQAFYNIVSAKDVIGIQAVPHVPEGYVIGGRLENYPENLVLVPEPKIIKQSREGVVTEEYGFGIRPQPSSQPGGGKDFLTLIGERATEIVYQNKDTVQGELAALGQVGIETFGGLVNLNIAGAQAFADFINATGEGKNTTRIIGGQEIILPETAPGIFVGGLSSGAMAAAVTKSPSTFLSAGVQAFQRAQMLTQKQGLLATIAQTTGYLAPFSPSAIIKAVPLRLVKVTAPVGRGIGLGATTEIETGILARQLKFGYGEGIGRIGIGRIGGLGYESEIVRPEIERGGTTFIGVPKAEKIPLEKIVYPTSRGGYRITEGPSGTFMTRPQTLDELIKIGKLEPEGKAVILAQKESVPITGKIKDIPLRTTLSPTGQEQPQASLLAGKETAKLEELVSGGQSRLKDKLPAVKGSIINQFFDIEPRQRRDLDVDLGLTKKSLTKQIALGIKEAKRIEEGMNALYNQEKNPERLFKWEGRSVEVTTKGKKPQKVIEFVTEKESLDYGKGFQSNPDIVFGAKVPRKVIQPGGRGTYKMLGYRFQGLRKTSSILELGGDMPKEAGQFLGVSKGREKDIRDNVEYLLTKASQTKNEKEAIKLKETAIITERFARSRGWWTEQAGIPTVEFAEVEPPNIITSISQGIKKGSGLGGGLAKSSLVSKPTTESDIEGITGKKEEGSSIVSSSIGRRFERSTGLRLRSSALGSTSRVTSIGSRSVSMRSIGSEKSVGQSIMSPGSPGSMRSTGGEVKSISSPSKPRPTSKILPSPGMPDFIPSPSIPSPGSPSTPLPSPGFGFGTVPNIRATPIKIPPLIKLETLQLEKTKPIESLFPKPGIKTERTKGNKQKPNDFVGNVSDVNVALGFNRKEITTGIKRSEKQYKKDILFAYKRGGFTKLVTQKTGSIISKRQRSILEREKPKEVKRQKRKTGGFF